MELNTGIALGTVVLAIVLFAIERIPLEVSALTLVAVLALTGVLTPEEAFAGFGNDTVIFIFTLLAMTQGLASTGIVQLMGQRASVFARFGQRTFLAAVTTVVAVFSSAVSNTVTTAALYPIAARAATRAQIPTSKVLMPLAFASMLGGTVLLFGTSTNLVVSAAMKGMGMEPIGVFELAPVGIPVAVLGLALLVLLGPVLLPAREGASDDEHYSFRDFLTEVVVTPDSRYVGRTLSEITEGLGLRVLGLLRNGRPLAPSPKEIIELQDRLIVEEDRPDLLRIKDAQGIELKSDVKLAEELPDSELVLVEATVPPGSSLVGKSLKASLFSDRYGLVVLGIHRHPTLRRATKLQLLERAHGVKTIGTLPLAVGDVLLLRGPRVRVAEFADGITLTNLTDYEYRPPRRGRAVTAAVIFLGSLALGSLGLVPLSVAGLAGMLLMIAFGCVDARDAFRVDWRVVLLIGSVLALGLAMEKSGAGLLLAKQLIRVAPYVGPRGVLVLLMLSTILLSAPMSNQAAALVLLPVAVATAGQLGVDPRSYAIGVCLSASCCFITPLEPSCVLVYGPGHYRFGDFLRLGAPLTLAVLALLTLAVPAIWPLDRQHRAVPDLAGLAPKQLSRAGPAHCADAVADAAQVKLEEAKPALAQSCVQPR